MKLIFIYGQPASGKLTVGRELARLTGFPLFHNHLIVDAVGAVFAFGTPSFVRLREEFWLRVFDEAASQDRSLIFTFAPEPTVDPTFAARVQSCLERLGGGIVFVALQVDSGEQERRLLHPTRSSFGKLQSLELLRRLRDDFARCMREMPTPDVVIDTTLVAPSDAARQIHERLIRQA